jgi:hypothetical protein
MPCSLPRWIGSVRIGSSMAHSCASLFPHRFGLPGTTYTFGHPFNYPPMIVSTEKLTRCGLDGSRGFGLGYAGAGQRAGGSIRKHTAGSVGGARPGVARPQGRLAASAGSQYRCLLIPARSANADYADGGALRFGTR